MQTEGIVKAVYVEQGVESQSYSVVFTYTVAGHFYGGTYIADHAPCVDDVVMVRYDPADPNRNDLVIKANIRKWVVGVLVFAVTAYILFRDLAK